MLQLTALWALSEALLGGVLHALGLPVTGLVVGGTAVVLICLMGWYGQSRAAVWKATLIVCIIKAMLSPHSPLPAYLAVLFQGLLGSLLVTGRSGYRLRCLVFAVLALLESALQKLIVLTVLFGMGFWQAVDGFVSSVLKIFGSQTGPSAQYLVWTYLSLHVLAGAVIGWLAASLPARNARIQQEHPDLPRFNAETDAIPLPSRTNGRKGLRSVFLFLGVGLAILLLQAWLQPDRAWLPTDKVIRLLVRSLVLLAAWYFILGPLLLRLFKRWLAGQQGKLQVEIQSVLTLLPETLNLVRHCWKYTQRESGMKRLNSFINILTINLFDADRATSQV